MIVRAVGVYLNHEYYLPFCSFHFPSYSETGEAGQEVRVILLVDVRKVWYTTLVKGVVFLKHSAVFFFCDLADLADSLGLVTLIHLNFRFQ